MKTHNLLEQLHIHLDYVYNLPAEQQAKARIEVINHFNQLELWADATAFWELV